MLLQSLPPHVVGYVFVATFGLSASIFSPAAEAQIPRQLTLESAIEVATRSNPAFLQVQNDVDAAGVQIRSAYGAFLPTVSVGTGFSSSYRETQTTLGDFGEPLSQPRAVISKTSNASQSLSIGSIVLFDGGQLFRNVGIAKTQRDVTMANIANQRNTLTANVSRAYYQIVNAEDRIDLERQLLAFAEDRLDFVQQQFRIAAARQTDLLGAELEVSQREQALSTAQSDARRRRLDLLQLLGVRGEPAFEVVSDIPPVIDPSTLDADQLVGRAVRSHPSVLQSIGAAEVAQRQASNSRARRLPVVSLSLPSYSWGATQQGLFDAWGEFGAPNNSFSFGIQASLPLFTGFSTSAQIAQANASAEDARYQAQQRQLQVETDVRSAIIDLEQAHRSLLLAQTRATIAQARLDLAQEEYRVGATNFTTLQQIIQSNDQEQRSVIEAGFTFLNARIALEERIGGPLINNE